LAYSIYGEIMVDVMGLRTVYLIHMICPLIIVDFWDVGIIMIAQTYLRLAEMRTCI